MTKHNPECHPRVTFGTLESPSCSRVCLFLAPKLGQKVKALRYLKSSQDMSYHQTIVEELPHTLEAARWSLTFNQGTGSIPYILLVYVDEVLGLAEGLEDKGS